MSPKKKGYCPKLTFVLSIQNFMKLGLEDSVLLFGTKIDSAQTQCPFTSFACLLCLFSYSVLLALPAFLPVLFITSFSHLLLHTISLNLQDSHLLAVKLVGLPKDVVVIGRCKLKFVLVSHLPYTYISYFKIVAHSALLICIIHYLQKISDSKFSDFLFSDPKLSDAFYPYFGRISDVCLKVVNRNMDVELELELSLLHNIQ